MKKNRRRLVSESKGVSRKMTESMTAQQLAKEIESAVDWLKNTDEGCSTIKLDYYPLAVCVGWQDGYDVEEDDGLIHSKSDPSWVIVAGIKVWTSDSMRTDFDWINSPYKENGEVIDNDVTLEAANPGGEATWLMVAYEKLVEYLENNHLTIEDDGKIVKEDGDDYYDESLKEDSDKKLFKEFKNKKKVSESKSRGRRMRMLRESYDDYNYYEAVKEDIESALEEDYYKEIIENAADRDDAYEELYDKLWVEDSVTGNASGSYTFSTYKAEEYICHNLELLCDAIEEFGGEASEYKRCLESPETADVTIRCYLLGQVLNEVLDEYEFGEEE